MELDNKDLPWIEKYRPSKIDDISHQLDTVSILNGIVETGQLPHMIFYGPPGIGKTTAAIALARQLFGKLYDDRVLELNASDERGIKVVREKIKKFAQYTLTTDDSVDMTKNAYKMIILDEADTMTDDTQFALRRIIEQYSKTTRFCLICNYITRIIDPITSRCTKLDFKPISLDALQRVITKIFKNENIGIDNIPELSEKIYKLTHGDLRNSITILQHAYYIDKKNMCVKDGVATHVIIKSATIDSISYKTPINLIQKLLSIITDNCDYAMLQRVTDEVISFGYSVVQVLRDLSDYLLTTDDKFSESQKCDIFIKIAEADYMLTRGSDEFIQLLYVLAFIKELKIKGVTDK
ncbi:MAG: ATPase [Faunusvirus sp.]|jgi:replication factor C subunit 2/4|uniref:ATPase n=1 Tax=Faunusvirus sp. TaxID=2487766 RepID=A0A3G4ZWI9_9VIRU|nr:MAG: ATPase [Faunusvirus sp.]